MTIYVRACPYDPNFCCHIGCQEIQDKPNWCTHRLDLYEEVLELEKEQEQKEPKSDTLEIKVDFN